MSQFVLYFSSTEGFKGSNNIARNYKKPPGRFPIFLFINLEPLLKP